jgi:hypothetical protein
MKNCGSVLEAIRAGWTLWRKMHRQLENGCGNDYSVVERYCWISPDGKQSEWQDVPVVSPRVGVGY